MWENWESEKASAASGVCFLFFFMILCDVCRLLVGEIHDMLYLKNMIDVKGGLEMGHNRLTMNEGQVKPVNCQELCV